MAIINAKYRSKCRVCDKPVAVGQRVEWNRNERGVECCSGKVLRDGPRRRSASTVAAFDAARAEMERGAAELERAMSRPVYSDRPATHPNSIPNDEVSRESVMHALGRALSTPAPGACVECGDTKIGDDGYDCKSCPPDAVPSTIEEPPEHVADFGPMPSDDDLPF